MKPYKFRRIGRPGLVIVCDRASGQVIGRLYRAWVNGGVRWTDQDARTIAQYDDSPCGVDEAAALVWDAHQATLTTRLGGEA